MIKFYLFDVINTYSNTYYDSLGIGYIKSYLEKDSVIRNNFDIKVLNKNIFAQLVKEKPQIVGFSSVTQDYTKAIKFAKKIRKYLPNTLFILGGIHISLLPESFHNIFNIGVINEGEVTVKKLLKKIMKKTLLSYFSPKIFNFKGIFIVLKNFPRVLNRFIYLMKRVLQRKFYL